MTKKTNNSEKLKQEVLQVTAGDLALMVKIIDAGSERGAWKGEELGTIGTIRTKLVAIVQSVAPATDPNSDAESEISKKANITSTVVEKITSVEPKTKPKRKRTTKPTAA